MMMNIAICDDDQNICTLLSDIVREYGSLNTLGLSVRQFNASEDLLEYLAEGEPLDLLFLDIELDELTGIDIGRKIRSDSKRHDLQIVYISGNRNYAMELFEVRPMNFLIKPFEKEKIFSMLDLAIELISRSHYLYFKIGSSLHKIDVKDIIYLESQGRMINMNTTSKKVSFYGKIMDIEESLKQYGFLSIHKSILINYSHVIEFYYDHVIMSDNTVLSISQSRRKMVRSYQHNYERGLLQ